MVGLVAEGWVDGLMPIYVLPASGRGFAFAKQGNKMRRLRRHNHEWAGGFAKVDNRFGYEKWT